MSHSIDAREKACPIPVILAKGAISQGETAFSVRVDNPTAVENLKRLAENQGFAAQTRKTQEDYTVDFIKAGCAAALETEEPKPRAGGGWAVFVGRDIVGDGDRALGANLMRMFFYTLAQSEDLPAAILFMNAGVKLPTLDGQVAEHLRTLQGKGCKVLVCGTCLDFYHLTDQLEIGTVSNMYDIVTAMQGAAKVITL